MATRGRQQGQVKANHLVKTVKAVKVVRVVKADSPQKANGISGADEALVDAAVAHLRKMWRQGLLTTVVAVGDYLIEKFYEGDLELASSRRTDKPMALTRLMERAAELPVSAHALRQSVRIAVQYHALPRALADGLTKEQHAQLLRIDDEEEKQKLAEDAVRQGLSTREIERRTRKLKRPHPGGRPGRPVLVMRVERALRVLDDATLRDLLASGSLRRLAPEERIQLEGVARQLRESAERISDSLARSR